MKKIVLLFTSLVGLLFVSCASASFRNLSTFPAIEPGSMPANRYIILGEVNGSSEIAVKTSDLTKEIKNDYSSFTEYLEVPVNGDIGKYGFIGKPAKRKLNVIERSVALAEYNLIQMAKYNEADAIICLKTTTEVKAAGSTSRIITRVSGYAVKIKADEGYEIKTPVVIEEPEEVPPVEEDAEEEAEEAEKAEDDSEVQTAETQPAVTEVEE
ncbi:MAG: hypothetical protein K6D95_00510 [Treponema sp.]|nr:hypothetical protein [Treponema sp.]